MKLTYNDLELMRKCVEAKVKSSTAESTRKRYDLVVRKICTIQNDFEEIDLGYCDMVE